MWPPNDIYVCWILCWHVLCIFAESLFAWWKMSAAAQNTWKLRQRAWSTLRWYLATCRSLTCHYFHTMDTCHCMCDDSFDWQSSTRDKSVGNLPKIHGYTYHLYTWLKTRVISKSLWSYYYGNLRFVTHSVVIVKLPLQIKADKMRTFEYVCFEIASFS